MYASDLIGRIRVEIHDTSEAEYTDSELLNYINDAISYLNAYLIGLNDIEMLQEITVTNGMSLPADLYSLAGSYPIYISNGMFHLYDLANPVVIRYFGTKPSIADKNHAVPFKELYTPILVRLASIYALNRNEYMTTQDMGFINQLIETIRVGKK